MPLAMRFLALFVLICALALSASAQVVTGTPQFGSFAGGPDVIDLGNLNVHIDIPVVEKAGRGTNFTYDLSYDTAVWYPSGGTWTPVYNWGWRAITEASVGYISYSQTSTPWCELGNQYTGTQTTWSNWVYHDPWGVAHYFGITTYHYQGPAECAESGVTTSASGSANGYAIKVNGAGVQSLLGPSGQQIAAPVNIGTGAGGYTDRNGNMITVGSSGQFYDTLNSTVPVLTVSGSGTSTSPTVYSYSPPSSSPNCAATNASFACYVMNYTNYTVATNFGVSGVGEYRSPGLVPLVSSVVLPDGSKYTFQYETTPGSCTPISGSTTCVTARVTEITLPTGGTIQYSYSGGNNGILSDGSAATLTRTLTPGGQWTYARTELSNGQTQVITTDPANNQMWLYFSGIYESSRGIYQGSTTSGTLVESITTAFTGSPITEKSVTTQFGTSGPTAITNTFYNSYGLMTGEQDYDYPSGTALIRSIAINYASLTNGIVDMPSSVIVCNGSGSNSSCYGGTGTIMQETTYSYDQATPQSPSGTPQHTSVTGSRGNATTINTYTSSNAYLTKTYSYFDTGNVNVFTDVNSEPYTYTYSSTGSCGNSFPTQVSAAYKSLSTSMTWNCTGGVQLTSTDANNQTTTTAYTDPDFWRPYSVTDPLNNATVMGYVVVSPGYEIGTSSSLEFNNNGSVVNTTYGNDGLGRILQVSHAQAPGSSNVNQVITSYDANGRVYTVSMPCLSAGPWTCPTTATTTTYDALNRVSQVIDGGGGTTTYAYNQNDVLVVQSPAPTGENTKQRQLEYNALGQLTSVCEITSGAGSGPCGQTNVKIGYWTKYAYNPLGQITSVIQNAQASSGTQTRTYVYDFLGRLTSETNPESATTTYVYDTASACGTWNGDLVEKVDAIGNVTCYSYDPLQRNSEMWYPSGSYAANTPTKVFVYDSATVNGTAMGNAEGRLAEAYTCTGSCTSKLTDEAFSYTARGEVSDIYESTPNSGTYFHVNETYWANGLPNQLSGLPGLPTITYGGTNGAGLDGEGRITQVTASSGQNPLTGATYNAASQPTQITFGSADSDSFGYDNMDRMNQYQFSVNGQSVTGTLSWNAIGTLGSLTISDPFNSANTQTCSYSHDDLVRIASISCTSTPAMSQTFGYDAFGNLTQSGSFSFLPTYSTNQTNQMSKIGSNTPTYDANGNVTNDFLNMYSWDANGKPIMINGIGITYDALGRMVEQDFSGSYHQIVYAPSGGKLASMANQTVNFAYVQLPAGAVAEYAAGGNLRYRHPDWLGSARFISTSSRGLYYDTAYSPFGSLYASTGTADYQFTGMNSDTSLTTYDFPAREYAPNGRWPSPDPAGLAAVNPTNPQTWNRYAYALNNPLRVTDPTGLDPCDDGGDSGDIRRLSRGLYRRAHGMELADCGDGGGDSGGGGDGGGGGGGGIPIPPDNGCAPGDFSCNPFQSADNPCAGNPYAGSCGSATQAFQSILAGNGVGIDPCVYLNNAGTGVESVDHNSNPQECGQHGGNWMPDASLNTQYDVDPWGNVYPVLNNPNYYAGQFYASQFTNWAYAQADYLGCVTKGTLLGIAGGATSGAVVGAIWGSPGGPPGSVGGATIGGLQGVVRGGVAGATVASYVCY